MAESDEQLLGFYVALQSTGIVEISFDPREDVNKALSIVSINTDAGVKPGWLTSFADKIYSISRTSYPASESESGGIFGFRKMSVAVSATSEAGLALFDQASSNGKGGVHCEVSPDGKILAAANITASTLSIYPLSQDGTMAKRAHILDYKTLDPGLKEAHPHQVAFDPSGQFLVVPLRTGDRVDIYSLQNPQRITKIHSILVPPLTGPRHVAFNPISPSKAYMYLVSERDNMIRVFALNCSASQELTVEFRQMLSTMGKNLTPSPYEHKDLAAEIAVSNDGRFVYASNRGLKNAGFCTLAIYSVDSDPAHDESHLTYLGCHETQGKHPRMFSLSNDKENKWLAVANQWSQDITIFERDPTTGFLKDAKGRISVKPADVHKSTPDKVSSARMPGIGVEMSREELLKGKTEGPMCVLWK